MPDYTLAVGTHDPHGFAAGGDQEAIRAAVAHIETRYPDDIRHMPQDVVTLMGPAGLVTRPSERIDEFLRRSPGPHAGIDTDRLQPGDTNTPDCNGS